MLSEVLNFRVKHSAVIIFPPQSVKQDSRSPSIICVSEQVHHVSLVELFFVSFLNFREVFFVVLGKLCWIRDGTVHFFDEELGFLPLSGEDCISEELEKVFADVFADVWVSASGFLFLFHCWFFFLRHLAGFNLRILG